MLGVKEKEQDESVAVAGDGMRRRARSARDGNESKALWHRNRLSCRQRAIAQAAGARVGLRGWDCVCERDESGLYDRQTA